MRKALPVRLPSEAAGAMALAALAPGKMPDGLADVGVVWKEGAVPACAPMAPLFMVMFPKSHWKARPLVSTCSTDANLASTCTRGLGLLSSWMTRSMVSKSCVVARTKMSPVRALKKAKAPPFVKCIPMLSK